MFEVLLVVIFDVDKEGFLCLECLLIQIIGCVVCNLYGKVIFYVDNVIGLMQCVIDEIEWCWVKQIVFNEVYGIVFKGVCKDIKDIFEGVVVFGVCGKCKGVVKVVEESGCYENELCLLSEISKCIC